MMESCAAWGMLVMQFCPSRISTSKTPTVTFNLRVMTIQCPSSTQIVMIARILEHFLSKYFEEIFFGINRKNIHTKLLEGKLVIENIGLQPEFFSKLNLPIELRASFVEKLSLEYPWREDNPNLVITIENIYAIVVDKYNTDSKIKQNVRRGKEKLVKDAIKEFASKLKEAKEAASNKEQSTSDRYLLKLLDNIEVRIKYIHMRYENRSDKFAFGLTIHQIMVETRDHENKKVFFNRDNTHQTFVRQVLEIGKLGIYWNSSEDMILSQMNHSLITSHMLEKPSSKILIEEEDSQQGPKMKNILTLKVSVTLKKLITLDEVNPQFEGTINFEEISCKVSQTEYSQIIKVVSYFLLYQARMKEFFQENELQNYKPKAGKEILSMMKQAYQTQEAKNYMKRCIREYMGWVFKSAREKVIKNKFIELVCSIPKKITAEAIFKNAPLVRIIQKTDNDRLKDWLFLALLSRTENEEKSPFVLKKNTDLLESTRKAFSKLGSIERLHKVKQEYVWLKVNGKIQKATFEIAEPSGLGLSFSFEGVEVSINLRQANFFAEMEIRDLNLVLFNQLSLHRAETSILRKNRINNFGPSETLLKVRMEKNPITKPYVFWQINIEFKSIEINIFPSSIKQLYQLFTEGIRQPKESKGKKKVQNSRQSKAENDYAAIKNFGFQRNIINARIHSPWIIVPLCRINDHSSDCWVLRLGDLEVNTPMEVDPKQQMYYEGYNVMLENFELKYFSSMRFFYNWLKFKDSQQLNRLFSSELIESGKSIQVVRPFSCSIHMNSLKSILSTNMADSNFKYKVDVHLQEIQIHYSAFITSKLKKSYEQFKRGESEKPIQFEREVILGNSSLQQSVIVNYKEFQNLKFYMVYYSGCLYLYLTENSPVHSLFLPITTVKLTLRSMQTEKSIVLNDSSSEDLEIFFEMHGQLLRWKVTLDKELALLSEPRTTTECRRESMKSQSNLSGPKNASMIEIKEFSKYSINVKMPKLSVKFFDENEVEFLDGVLGEIELQMSQKFSKEIYVSINKFLFDGPTFKELPMLITSESFSPEDPAMSPTYKEKFMQLTVRYDELNSSIQEIDLKFKRLTLAWKVDLIQKILQFLSIDITTPPSLPSKVPKKREITIRATMETWKIICIHSNFIFAEAGLSDAVLGYHSARNRETYSFKGRVEFYGFKDNVPSSPYPVFTARNDSNLVPRFEVSYVSGVVPSTTPELQRSRSHLQVLDSPPVMKMRVEGYQLVYVNEFFNRLFNYILNKIIGSATSKFRIKREYEPEYIFEVMKSKKSSVFDISLNQCLFVFPGDIHEGSERLLLTTKRISISRNLDPAFALETKQIPTKLGNMPVNYEKMLVTCHDAQLFYVNDIKMERTRIIEGIIGFQIQYNKFNLSKEYFPVLRDIKDFDLTANIIVLLDFPVEIHLQKAVLLQMMRTYYRNIKQKDSLATEYEPASLHPTPRVYTVNIPAFRISFMEEINSKFTPFFTATLPFIKISARELRSDISAIISTENLEAQVLDGGWGNLICPLNRSNCPIRIEAKGSSGDIAAQVKLTGLSIFVDMNQLNNVIDFVDFDPSDVDNQRMPKKLRKSFQNIKIFLKESVIHVESQAKSLQLKGVFFVDYSKNPEGFLDQEVKTMFGDDVKHSEINEKDIKVNVQNLEVIFNSIAMSELPNLMYRRHEITNRVVGKKLRRENVFLQQFLLCLNTGMISDLQALFNQRLKRDAKTKKSFFEANSVWTAKRKYDERRKYIVCTEPISLILLGQPLHKNIEPIIKVNIQVMELVAVLVNSLPEEVSAVVNASLWNKGYKLDFLELVNASNLSVSYLTHRDSRKSISVSGNTIKVIGHNIHEEVINKLIALKDTIKLTNHNKHAALQLRNDTDMKVKLSLREVGCDSILECNLGVFDVEDVEISQLNFCKLFEGNIQLVLTINQQSFVIQLRELQLDKLFNIGNLLYLLVRYSDKDLLEIRFETRFRLENMTSLRFRYFLLADTKVKSGGTLLPKKNVNINFESSDRLCLREEISKEEVVLELNKITKKLVHFNVSLQLQNKAIYVCRIYPKIVVLNQLPCRISFSHSKYALEFNKYQQQELSVEDFFSKKEITIQLQGENYRCETNFFRQIEATLELISPNNNVKINIHFGAKENNHTVEWTLSPPLVLLNASYRSLALKNNIKVPHLSTLILSSDEPLRLGSMIITPFKMKANEEVAVSPAMILQMIHLPKSKTPVLMIHPEILFVNESSINVIVNNKYKVARNQALPIEENPESIPFSLNSAVDKTLKNIDFSRKNEYYFFLKGEKGLQKLKLVCHLFGLKRVIVLNNDKEHYSLKNNLQGWTLTIKQKGGSEEFIVRENTTQTFSVQDPAAQEVFGVEFYLNKSNKEFHQRLLLDLNIQEQLEEFILDEQGECFAFEVNLKKTSKGFTLVVDVQDHTKLKKKEDMELSIKHLTVCLIFHPNNAQEVLTMNLSKLFLVIEKQHLAVLYKGSVDSLDLQFKDTSVLKKNKLGSLFQFVCIFNHSNRTIELEQVEAKCNTLTLNLKEDIVSEIFNTLKNINLLSDKKTMESRQRSLLVEELLKGYAGLNDLKKLSLKFETKNASSKSSKNILVRRLKIHAISCTLSYIKKSNLQLDDIQDHAILKYLLVLPDIRQLQVHLPQLSIENYEGDQKSLKKKISSHVKKSIPSHIVSSINSLSVFESPVDALDMIGHVVDALFSFK